ncbi:MAG TPA: RodZ domain-containing protein [Candidatus Didemnitutus sp.]|nr:RodZ domain-containing protein [Candidatus Didemnitutus sp.]
MQTIGERLEEARKRKGISVREAAEITKIRSDYLQKFESNTFELDLPPLYIRGFIRTYARYLDLEPDRIVAEFDSAIAGEGRSSRRESREVYGRVEFGETAGGGSASPAAPARPAMDQAMLLKYGLLGGGALVAIVVIILLINVLTSRSANKSAPPTAQPPTQAEAQQIAPPADTTQTVTFTGIATSRLKVVQDPDGKVLFNASLAGGETRSFRKTGTLLITVEDRTKVRMEINGKAMDIPSFANGNYGRFKLE